MRALTVNVHFLLVVSVAVAFFVSGVLDNLLNYRNHYAVAFCSNGRIIDRKRFRASSMSAGHGNNFNEIVAYLEEEFNRSGSEADKKDPDEDNLHPIPQQRTFQTSVKTHTNVIDLLDEIDTAPSNILSVVLFFANYCKMCQQAIIPFKQVANDMAERVRFIRYETSALSPKEFKSMGIDKLPFLQIYRNGICVASFSATQKISKTSRKMVLRPRLLEHIDTCERRSLADWSTFRDCYDKEIEANKAARAKIREAIDGKYSADYNDDEERLYRSIRTLTSESELLRLIHGDKDYIDDDRREEGPNNCIVVIMFHSHFDPSCRRAQHKFRKIASERQYQYEKGMERTPCTMARIETSLLPDQTLRSFGIQRYPHIHIYRISTHCSEIDGNRKSIECVASFSIPRSFLFAKMLHESLDTVVQRTPEEWTEFYNQHRNEIEAQKLAVKEIIHNRVQR